MTVIKWQNISDVLRDILSPWSMLRYALSEIEKRCGGISVRRLPSYLRMMLSV